jgi:hypothetical protein
MATKRSSLVIPGKTKTPAPAPQPVVRDGQKGSASREGKAAVPFWVPTTARTQLRILAAEQDQTMQDLLTEALNDLFVKYQKPAIA